VAATCELTVQRPLSPTVHRTGATARFCPPGTSERATPVAKARHPAPAQFAVVWATPRDANPPVPASHRPVALQRAVARSRTEASTAPRTKVREYVRVRHPCPVPLSHMALTAAFVVAYRPG
jgi:hypothetical protein